MLTLERFLNWHCAAYVSLTHSAEHVTAQLPDERTRVGYLTTNINIESTDADIKVTIDVIKVDDMPGELCHNFEQSVALLLPICPAKRKLTGKRKLSESLASLPKGARLSRWHPSRIKVSCGPLLTLNLKAHKKDINEHRPLPSKEKGVGARTKK